MKLTVRWTQAPARVGQWPLRRAIANVLRLPDEVIFCCLLSCHRIRLSASSAHYTRRDFRDASEADAGQTDSLFPDTRHLV